jgi:hypothetical protein
MSVATAVEDRTTSPLPRRVTHCRRCRRRITCCRRHRRVSRFPRRRHVQDAAMSFNRGRSTWVVE